MKEENITIQREELRQLFERMLERLGEETNLEADYYLSIPADEWEEFEDSSEPVVGSLHDDWSELRQVIEEDRLFTAVDFDRLAAILKAISEEVIS